MKKGRRLSEIEAELKREREISEKYMRRIAFEEALENEFNEVHDPLLDPWLPSQEEGE